MNTAQRRPRPELRLTQGELLKQNSTMPTNSAAAILRLAVTALSREELHEWLSKPSALAARRFLASLPAPFVISRMVADR